MQRKWLLAIPVLLAVALLLLWLARAAIAVQFAQAYFKSHGVPSSVEIGSLGLSGASARFSLGPQDAPELSAQRIELHFDPLRWMPYVVEVRLVNPVVRAAVDADGKVSLGSLQAWIDSLSRQQGKSRFISDDLTVSLTGLRLLLATPGGALEVGGDVRLVKNLPVLLALRAKPARIAYRDMKVAMRSASLSFDRKAARLGLQFSGAAANSSFDIQGLELQADASGLTWRAVDRRFAITAPSVHLRAAAHSAVAGQTVRSPKLDAEIRNFSAVSSSHGMDASADIAVTSQASFDAPALASLQAADPVLTHAIRQNLGRLSVAFAGHAQRRGDMIRFNLTRNLQIRGAKGASLDIPALSLSGSQNGLTASLDASLAGRDLPLAKMTLRNLFWSGGGFTSDAALSARFNFAMLHGTAFSGRGKFSWQNGQYAFTPLGCVRATLAAFHPGASDLAKNVRGEICAPPQQPLLTGEGIGWTLSGQARNASADLPLASVHAENIAAKLDFDGEGAPLRGTATVTAGQVQDRAASLRFKPLLGTGTASLAKGIWTGRFAATDLKHNALGEAAFTHTMATGTGTAHIHAPHIAFAPNRQQPADLSPLLVGLRNAEGSAAFAGDINWTRDTITSQGKLTIAALDFMTVLGKAHAVKSEIAFTSLLPPATASGQGLTISRIDWTIPFSAVDVRFAFSPATIQIAKADTDIAEGHASLGAINISLADPGHVAGAVQITSVSLNSLVTASNLSSKVKLEGKVSGRIPFEISPEGFRITNGHVAADGPGRLSVNRSLWAQGDAAINSNAVQDFAYQALENLAFDQMSADLNSVANGRLNVVFHIKGKSAPPKPQVAEVAIADIVNGTAMYKPIPLPSGTPIDLTLDTSLNFDELLKSYAEAWSKSLSPEGQPDNPSAGVKP
ncbi:MAG TPA: YdbH domain-containing protein [Rhizomicrobium sp.]|nr:YdbH domain-containing protein [Rhizomicrobium sp.]